jgi:hypothetical protein
MLEETLLKYSFPCLCVEVHSLPSISPLFYYLCSVGMDTVVSLCIGICGNL